MADNLNDIIISALEDTKARDIVTLDVRELSDVMDTLIIASGTSSRHVKSLADHAIEETKKHDIRPIGVEGMDAPEWVLVDFGDTVLHLMMPATRELYDLEKLWSMKPSDRQQ
ncbi:ribosome silencing factor [Simiduia sp. 21SJ11W-1]|uniref:ribosome silencing factor n=1 Tax=Simiduia sp. 21SJ11W-1 TaxID=2909669 RepID=UPI00209CCA79|nr:ribosome silencing factor [Simiduia sp. 21SJ11W-1]UTA48695.1 ribosome silencing factor [Simiduia sp. 21SJ11W-1]